MFKDVQFSIYYTYIYIIHIHLNIKKSLLVIPFRVYTNIALAKWLLLWFNQFEMYI